jgi:hypothetical protein
MKPVQISELLLETSTASDHEWCLHPFSNASHYSPTNAKHTAVFKLKHHQYIAQRLVKCGELKDQELI